MKIFRYAAAGIRNVREYISRMTVNFSPMIKDIRGEMKKRPDMWMVAIIMTLIMTGVIMIYSANMYESSLTGNTNYAFSQIKYAIVGLVCMYIVSLINYGYYRYYSGLMVFTVIIMLSLVLLGFGSTYMGANRGLSIGPISFMPVEIAKIAVLLFMADTMEKNAHRIEKFGTFVNVLLFTGVIALLIVKQPALSSSIIVAGLIIGMFFMAGGKLTYIFSLGFMAVGAIAAFIAFAPWRLKRLMSFLDPFSDLQGGGWQPAQSLMALGSGGFFGQGIGKGVAKLNYLPESQNDYIFSIIGEELGFLGCVFVIITFALLIIRLIRIAFSAKDMFGRLISSGMAVLIGIQVFLNLMVVTNSMPSTGVSLPFISYGGSSLVTLLIGMGVCLNVSRNMRH